MQLRNSSPDSRSIDAHRWVGDVLRGDCTMRPLAGDASFRRYFRISHGEETFVLMDAPPPHEDVHPFLAVRDWFEQAIVKEAGRLHLHTDDASLLEAAGFDVHISVGDGRNRKITTKDNLVWLQSELEA